MNSDLYQSYYEAEWTRRSEIESKLSIPVSILTVLAGGLFFLVSAHEFACDPATYIFGALFAASATAFLAAVVFVVRSFQGYRYQRIPTSQELGDYYQQLLSYHAATDGQPRDAHKDFEAYLNARYAEATERNAWNNISKLPYLHRANTLIVATFIFAALAAVPAAVNSYLHPEPASRVELVNVDQLRDVVRQVMSETQEKPAQPTPQPASPAPQKPPKPQGPPNHEIREGQQPPRPGR